MDIVEDFDEKSYSNNGKPWKSSRILRVNPNFFIFLYVFISIFSLFHFFHFYIFEFFTCPFFHFLSFSLIFVHFLCLFFCLFLFHFLSCSFMFFHFLSFSFSFYFMFFHVLSFSLLGAQNMIFWGLNFVTISLDSSYQKKTILGPISGGTPL